MNPNPAQGSPTTTANAQTAPANHEDISKAFDTVAPAAASNRLPREPHLALVDLACDFFVAGGGMDRIVADCRAGGEAATVRCVSAEFLLKFKTSYPPRATDQGDIAALCGVLGLPLPDTQM